MLKLEGPTSPRTVGHMKAMPALGPEVFKQHLLWAIWSTRVCAHTSTEKNLLLPTSPTHSLLRRTNLLPTARQAAKQSASLYLESTQKRSSGLGIPQKQVNPWSFGLFLNGFWLTVLRTSGVQIPLKACWPASDATKAPCFLQQLPEGLDGRPQGNLLGLYLYGCTFLRPQNKAPPKKNMV